MVSTALRSVFSGSELNGFTTNAISRSDQGTTYLVISAQPHARLCAVAQPSASLLRFPQPSPQLTTSEHQQLPSSAPANLGQHSPSTCLSLEPLRKHTAPTVQGADPKLRPSTIQCSIRRSKDSASVLPLMHKELQTINRNYPHQPSWSPRRSLPPLFQALQSGTAYPKKPSNVGCSSSEKTHSGLLASSGPQGRVLRSGCVAGRRPTWKSRAATSSTARYLHRSGLLSSNGDFTISAPHRRAPLPQTQNNLTRSLKESCTLVALACPRLNQATASTRPSPAAVHHQQACNRRSSSRQQHQALKEEQEQQRRPNAHFSNTTLLSPLQRSLIARLRCNWRRWPHPHTIGSAPIYTASTRTSGKGRVGMCFVSKEESCQPKSSTCPVPKLLTSSAAEIRAAAFPPGAIPSAALFTTSIISQAAITNSIESIPSVQVSLDTHMHLISFNLCSD
ncbi:hypothetical protein KC19_VG104300 [Ceratodon purpureus]|uniref:Uncharacterized protein n=1 Tax=Ceratodon purpureus TaxID=3225 RepID=A0A8T0HNZ1_CERPU|nr:hypothetical protein KC19_VG104300 [Ceratodon purpureus]